MPPVLSPNTAALMARAQEEAQRRGHTQVCTSHVVHAIALSQSRALGWIAQQTFSTAATTEDPTATSSPHERMGQALIAALELQPNYATRPATSGDYPLPLSRVMARGMRTAQQIGALYVGGDNGEPLAPPSGMVASEFLLCGLLVASSEGVSEPHGSGGAAIAHASQNRAVSSVLMVDINVQSLPPRSPTSPASPHAAFPFSVAALPALTSIPASPTSTSNWLVPHHLLIGAQPTHADVPMLVSAGITHVVCLRAEVGSVSNYCRKLGIVGTPPFAIRYFPVYDFEAVSADVLAPFLLQLRDDIQGGARIMVHCYGGHGRTALVVIPLMCMIFGVGIDASKQYVYRNTVQHRESDKGATWISMPESVAQEDVIHQVYHVLKPEA